MKNPTKKPTKTPRSVSLGTSSEYLADAAARQCARAVIDGNMDRARYWAGRFAYWQMKAASEGVQS